MEEDPRGSADRKDRDELVDRACASAGLAILHVRAAGAYSARDVAKQIAEKLPGV